MPGIHNSRRGASLAYVLVAALALMILSGAVAGAATRSLSLTEKSITGRQTYLTAKSAVEYAKAAAYQKAQDGSLSDFSVERDGSGNFALITGGEPDGVNVLAKCAVTGDAVKIDAMAKYDGSERYRKLGYTFQLEKGSGMPDNFMAIGGGNYGSGDILNNGDTLKSASTNYPFLSKVRLKCQSNIGEFCAPQMYFMQGMSVKNHGSEVTLRTNFIYWNGVLSSNVGTNEMVSVRVKALDHSMPVILCFHQVTLSLPGKSFPVQDGYYELTNPDINLLTLDEDNFDESFTRITLEEDDFYPNAAQLDYVQANYANMYSGQRKGSDGGAGWSVDRKLSTDPKDETGNYVLMYTDKGQYNSDLRNADGKTVLYKADTIVWQHRGDSEPMIIPTRMTFQANTLWLNEQSEDGMVSSDGDDDDVFTIQKSKNGSFFLRSPSGSGNVTVNFPHGLKVYNSDGNELYSLDSGTYTVASGTNLFGENKLKKKMDSGSTGGSGSLTFSNGRFTD